VSTVKFLDPLLTLFDVVELVLYLSAKELIIGFEGSVLSTLTFVPEITDSTIVAGIVGLFKISCGPLTASQSELITSSQTATPSVALKHKYS
jgi:hypothetical protein